MEIEYKGGNCVVITHKKDEFVVDPGVASLGLKDQGNGAAALLLTQDRFAPTQTSDDTLIISMPGEYEVRNCSIRGVAAKTHTADDNAQAKSTMYRLDAGEINVAILGHVNAKLTESQLEQLGVVDILILPVGGYGYTLEPKEAAQLVKAIEPKIVIPTHYAQQDINYEVPQATLDEFVKEIGVNLQEPIAKLKLKAGQLPDTLTIYELTRTK